MLSQARTVFLAALALAVVSQSSTCRAAPVIGGCPIFPDDNIWNVPVDGLPLHPDSAAYISSIGAREKLHADFGEGEYDGKPIGIPFLVVPADQPATEIVFSGYADEAAPFPDESDPGPFPIPIDAPIEGGRDGDGDRHVLVLQEGTCMLFELYKAVPNENGTWNAVGSAKFDLRSNMLRPAGWTSADAAGLPILPGLLRREEIPAGEIEHAIRFTAPRTRKEYVWPARHFASDDDDPGLPPMGQRFRLEADFDTSGFSPTNQIILKALKKYGIILADNGSAWFLSGAPHDSWNNDELRGELGRVTGADFEAVDTSSLMKDPDSAAAGR